MFPYQIKVFLFFIIIIITIIIMGTSVPFWNQKNNSSDTELLGFKLF